MSGKRDEIKTRIFLIFLFDRKKILFVIKGIEAVAISIVRALFIAIAPIFFVNMIIFCNVCINFPSYKIRKYG